MLQRFRGNLNLNIKEQYLSFDSRVKAIRNDVNHVTSYARNCGLDIATGNYITFVD